MLSTAIIVFREILEAALIIGVVLAASRGVVGRNKAVFAGIFGGLAGAVLVALFAGEISSAVAGSGQELFNATVLLIAVVMLGWHNVWMKRHGREMARAMADIGAAVRSGGRPIRVWCLPSESQPYWRYGGIWKDYLPYEIFICEPLPIRRQANRSPQISQTSCPASNIHLAVKYLRVSACPAHRHSPVIASYSRADHVEAPVLYFDE